MALATRPDSSAYRLLALLGPPGSAKSTMVRLLAEEMGVELAEWQASLFVFSIAIKVSSVGGRAGIGNT